MKYIILITGLVLWTSYAAAQSILPGFPPGLFGSNASLGGAAAPAPTGKLLLVDGTSFLLLANGTDKLCLAGGC